MGKEYTAWFHWKQGDELHGYLKNSSTPSEAFSLWAEQFKSNADLCKQLSEKFAILPAEDISVEADTHHIAFCPHTEKAEELLNTLVEEKLIEAHEYDDEEE